MRYEPLKWNIFVTGAHLIWLRLCIDFSKSLIARPNSRKQIAGGLLGDIVNGGGEVLDVLGGDADHGDAAVLGEVDGILFLQALNLRHDVTHRTQLGNASPTCSGVNPEKQNMPI